MTTSREAEERQDRLDEIERYHSIPNSIRDEDFDWLISEVRRLRAALIKSNPKWDSCKHDWEPDSAMEYFRCDKCGIRPHEFEALRGEE